MLSKTIDKAMRHIRNDLYRIVNYHTVSPRPIRRYLDFLRCSVESFPATVHNRQAMNDLVQLIDENLGSLSNKRILDVGCGDGYLLSKLLEKQRDVATVGISVCRDDITRAHHSHKVKVRFGDMHSIPMPKDSFDMILARHVLEHSPMPVFALFEMRRVLRNDGHLIIVIPANKPFWIEYNGHFHCMPKENWYKLFNVAGWAVESEFSGQWFASATKTLEEEWRFILRPSNDLEHAWINQESIYVDVLKGILQKALLKCREIVNAKKGDTQ